MNKSLITVLIAATLLVPQVASASFTPAPYSLAALGTANGYMSALRSQVYAPYNYGYSNPYNYTFCGCLASSAYYGMPTSYGYSSPYIYGYSNPYSYNYGLYGRNNYVASVFSVPFSSIFPSLYVDGSTTTKTVNKYIYNTPSNSYNDNSTTSPIVFGGNYSVDNSTNSNYGGAYQIQDNSALNWGGSYTMDNSTTPIFGGGYSMSNTSPTNYGGDYTMDTPQSYGGTYQIDENPVYGGGYQMDNSSYGGSFDLN